MKKVSYRNSKIISEFNVLVFVGLYCVHHQHHHHHHCYINSDAASVASKTTIIINKITTTTTTTTTQLLFFLIRFVKRNIKEEWSATLCCICHVFF